MILIVHNNQDKQKSKFNYIHCTEVYLVDLTEEKNTKFQTMDCAGAGLDT